MDRIKVKLASWKGVLLTDIGRIQLVKSVVHGMLAYSFQIYVWLISLIKTLDSWIRNFVLSGNIDNRKLLTVPWHSVYKPVEDGGLGVKSKNLLTLQLC